MTIVAPTRRKRIAAALFVACVAIGSIVACHDTKVGPGEVAAVSLDTIPYPSIVAGDSLRDSLGIARPLRGIAFGNDGEPIQDFVLKYRVLDSGIVLDSLTGYAVADTARSTPIRILVDAAGLQTTPIQLFVVPPPDTFFTADSVDTVTYSFADTSAVVSSALTVVLGHKVSTTVNTAGYIPVQAYLVSYQFENPADTIFANITDAVSHNSLVDTTDNTGAAHPQLRVHPLALPSGADSVVILASARYRGALLAGSPIRLVVHIQHP